MKNVSSETGKQKTNCLLAHFENTEHKKIPTHCEIPQHDIVDSLAGSATFHLKQHTDIKSGADAILCIK